ncbi:hypothetical protein AB1Y20_022583 [Prymnesium parvum]|uniref:Uncharacterized protein n=1 Tax=Prymnesium parvum TaxID=97485 RepID=A0AB34JHK4_PRYPA
MRRLCLVRGAPLAALAAETTVTVSTALPTFPIAAAAPTLFTATFTIALAIPATNSAADLAPSYPAAPALGRVSLPLTFA